MNLTELASAAKKDLRHIFERFDRTSRDNTARVLAAFRNNRVSDSHFGIGTGYGYNDTGRDVLDKVLADIFGAEDGLMRINLVSGTHAITCALFAALSPGQLLLSAVGEPYDTLHGVIGISGDYPGSLRRYGIGYKHADTVSGLPDLDAVSRIVEKDNVGAVLIQRSKGYSDRKSLSAAEVDKISSAVKTIKPGVNVIVDDCYGEFTEAREPLADAVSGADLLVGSLIKNPGGGVAPTGGYIAGRHELVEAASMRMTAPGIGRHCGCSLGQNRLLYQGLFMAPHTVAQALKTAAFAAFMLDALGYRVSPGPFDDRFDIVQSVSFGSEAELIRFCRGIQAGSPVDGFAVPEPWDMPGYDCQVIMASGSFIQGSSIELSCDAPIRPPYTAYLQGGLSFEAGEAGIMTAVQALTDA